jgi:hypothetical protein
LLRSRGTAIAPGCHAAHLRQYLIPLKKVIAISIQFADEFRPGGTEQLREGVGEMAADPIPIGIRWISGLGGRDIDQPGMAAKQALDDPPIRLLLSAERIRKLGGQRSVRRSTVRVRTAAIAEQHRQPRILAAHGGEHFLSVEWRSAEREVVLVLAIDAAVTGEKYGNGVVRAHRQSFEEVQDFFWRRVVADNHEGAEFRFAPGSLESLSHHGDKVLGILSQIPPNVRVVRVADADDVVMARPLVRAKMSVPAGETDQGEMSTADNRARIECVRILLMAISLALMGARRCALA